MFVVIRPAIEALLGHLDRKTGNKGETHEISEERI